MEAEYSSVNGDRNSEEIRDFFLATIPEKFYGIHKDLQPPDTSIDKFLINIKALEKNEQTRKRLSSNKPASHERNPFDVPLRNVTTAPRNSRKPKRCNKCGGFGHNLGVGLNKSVYRYPTHFRRVCPFMNEVRVTIVLGALDEANDNEPEDILQA